MLLRRCGDLAQGLNTASANPAALAADIARSRCPQANPNGSIENIAGICNRAGNVFGLMPHPDRAAEARLGSADGTKIFRSMMEAINAGEARAA